MKNTLLATLILAALVAPPLAAQDEAGVRRQEAEGWVLELAGKDTFLDQEELARALAEIEILIDVDRDEPTAELRFAELGNRCWTGLGAAPGDANRREVLRLTIESYGVFLIERGQLDLALQVLGEDLEQLGDRPVDVALRAVFADPRLVAMREQVGARLGESQGPASRMTGEVDPVRAAVQYALEENDQEFVARLGTAALPALETMIREAPNRIHVRGIDPLVSLGSLAPTRALAVIGELASHGGPVWRSRVMAALLYTDMLDSDGDSAFYPAAWELAVSYIERPDTGDQAWDLISKVDRRKLPAPLWNFVRSAVTSEAATVRAKGLSLLQGARDDEEVKAFARELLAAPHDDTRYRAAHIVVVTHEDRGPLPTLAKDDDPEIRALAAEALSGSRTATEQAALERLLTDPHEQVRRIALKALQSSPMLSVSASRVPSNGYRVWAQPPSDEVMRALAADPSPAIRGVILQNFDKVPEAAKLPFLEVALEGPNAREVLANTDEVVRPLLYSHDDDGERYFKVVRLLIDLAPELPRSDRAWAEAARSWKEDPVELRASVDLACETENPDLLLVLFESADTRGQREPGGRLDPRLAGLEAGQWVRLARASDRSVLSKDEVGRLVAEMPASVRADLASLLREPTSSGALRLAAATRLTQLEEPGMEDLVLEGLRGDGLLASIRQPRSGGFEPGRSLASSLRAMWETIDRARRNSLIGRMLRDPLVQAETAAYFAATFEPKEAEGPAIASAILERWSGGAEASEAMFEAVRAVLGAMADVPEIRDDAWLAKTLRVKQLESYALRTLEQLHDPAHLDLLVGFLGQSRFTHGSQQVLRIIASYQNEDAVQALVNAAASASREEDSEYCLKMLERIRQLHEARELWRELASEKHSREGSVTELLALLDDPSEAVQIQAVRGLATFGAIEAIPALIRRMKDASPTLRAEVEAALEKLNRSEGE